MRTSRIAALIGDPHTRYALRVSMRGHPYWSEDAIEFCSGPAELLEFVTVQWPDVVISESDGQLIDHLRVLLPRSALVGVLAEGWTAREILSLAHAADAVITVTDWRNPVGVGQLLVDAKTRRLEALVMSRLSPILSTEGSALVSFVLRSTYRPLTVGKLTNICSCTTPTLNRRLGGQGLPSANKLIVWCRLFHATWLLENSRRSIERVALLLEFPSRTALENQMRRYLDLPPSAVRQKGLDRVIDLFAEHKHRGDWAMVSI